MSRRPKNKRRSPSTELDKGGIEIYTMPTKLKKEEIERKAREQEATRESD